MLLGNEDIVSLHSQVLELERKVAQQERVLSELQRLAEPTALAEKFLNRLRDQLLERRQRRDEISQAAANENS